MRRALSLLLIAFSISACSVYKSAMRKDFESASAGRVTPASVDGCEKLPTGTAWLQKEFPSTGTELLVADNDVEAWKITNADGTVTLRTFRSIDGGTESCRTTFSSEAQWQVNEQAFLEAL